MKKIIAVMMALALAVSFAACAKQGDGGKAPKTLAGDTSVMAMCFAAPEGYETVGRVIDKTADGVITEKNIVYNFADGAKLTFAYGANLTLSELFDLTDKETAEYGGRTFYLTSTGKTMRAFAQEGEDLYCINFDLPDEDSRARYDAVAETVSFVEEKETQENGDDLYAINWSFDEAWNCVSASSYLEETPDGAVKEKSMTWRFGADADNVDFRFEIIVYKDAALADQLDDEKQYVEEEINGVTYSVLAVSEDEKPYDYYVQQGDDVYRIKNLGVSNGLFSSRSEESDAAFAQFMNGISFS
ncbi:MAG: hypothetical protein IJT27_04190 [Clostridia bacterium]|nr:hypothetical protein [Clostridia bacterium]